MMNTVGGKGRQRNRGKEPVPDVELMAGGEPQGISGLSAVRHLLLPAEGECFFSKLRFFNAPSDYFGEPVLQSSIERFDYKTPAGHRLVVKKTPEGGVVSFTPRDYADVWESSMSTVWFVGDRESIEKASKGIRDRCTLTGFEQMTGKEYDLEHFTVIAHEGVEIAHGVQRDPASLAHPVKHKDGYVNSTTVWVKPRSNNLEEIVSQMEASDIPQLLDGLNLYDRPVDLDVHDLRDERVRRELSGLIESF